jgi:hypothetical protein
MVEKRTVDGVVLVRCNLCHGEYYESEGCDHCRKRSEQEAKMEIRANLKARIAELEAENAELRGVAAEYWQTLCHFDHDDISTPFERFMDGPIPPVDERYRQMCSDREAAIQDKYWSEAKLAMVGKWADENEYPCICSEEYKRIGRVDPSCRKCDSGFDELRDIISDQRKVLAVVSDIVRVGGKTTQYACINIPVDIEPETKVTVIVLKKGGE